MICKKMKKNIEVVIDGYLKKVIESYKRYGVNIYIYIYIYIYLKVI